LFTQHFPIPSIVKSLFELIFLLSFSEIPFPAI
jgi:hypothetical protein